METLKKNFTLVLALAIPVAMVLFIMLSIYIPRLTTHPEVKFLYAVQKNYSYPYDGITSSYQVIDHKLEQIPGQANYRTIKQGAGATTTKLLYPTLFVYDSVTDTSTEVSFDTAKAFNLDPRQVTADGYHVSRGSNGDFLVFGRSNNYNQWYLKNGTYSKKMNLTIATTDQYYYNDLRVLGWITK
jgi:hypothetical protein